MVRSFAVLVACLPVLWFAWHAAERAYQIARQDHKERMALKLAESFPPFARAWATAQKMRPTICGADSPWKRPEAGRRSVYVMRQA